MTQRMTTQSGFTLLETLLVIGISGLLVLGVAQMAKDWVNNEAAKGAGQQLQDITTIVDAYIRANPTLVTNDDIIAGVNAGTLVNWNPLLSTNLASYYDAVNAVIPSPLGTNLKIAYKQDGSVRRLIIYGETALPNAKVRAAARQAGAYGGAWLNFPNSAIATGAFGQWRVPNTQLSSFLTAPTAQRGYILSVIEYRDPDLYGPYLYRQDITGQPQLNRMGVDLDMGGKNIANVSNVDAVQIDTTSLGTDSLSVTGNASFNQGVTINNSLTTNTLNVTGNATIDNVTATTTLNAQTINTQSVTNTSPTTPLTITGNVTLGSGTLDANTLNANCVNVGGVVYGAGC